MSGNRRVGRAGLAGLTVALVSGLLLVDVVSLSAQTWMVGNSRPENNSEYPVQVTLIPNPRTDVTFREGRRADPSRELPDLPSASKRRADVAAHLRGGAAVGAADPAARHQAGDAPLGRWTGRSVSRRSRTTVR